MLYFRVLASLAAVISAALLYYKYPYCLGKKSATLGVLGVILLLFLPVIIPVVTDMPMLKNKPSKEESPIGSIGLFEQKGAKHRRSKVRPANKDVVGGPGQAPVDSRPAVNPSPGNSLNIVIEPLGENVPPGEIYVKGFVEGVSEPPLINIDGFLSANGSPTWILWGGRLLNDNRFRILIKTEADTKYALRVKVTDKTGNTVESAPVKFSTGSAR